MGKAEKRCPRCAETKVAAAFNKNRKKKDGLSSYCTACSRAYTREHHAKNRAYYSRKATKRVKELRLEARQLIHEKKSVPCTDCGLKHPYWRMQFDHVRGTKLFNVSRGVDGWISFRLLLEEIEKCEVVCANCHADRTHFRAQSSKDERQPPELVVAGSSPAERT